MSVALTTLSEQSHPSTPEQSNTAILHPLFCVYADGAIFLRTPKRAEAEKAVECILRTPGRYGDLRVCEDRRSLVRVQEDRRASIRQAQEGQEVGR